MNVEVKYMVENLFRLNFRVHRISAHFLRRRHIWELMQSPVACKMQHINLWLECCMQSCNTCALVEILFLAWLQEESGHGKTFCMH